MTDFLTAYQQNCALNGSIPIKPILNGAGGTALFIDISKIRASDWPPFLQSLSKAKSLSKIDFYSSWDGRQPIPIIHQERSSVTRQIMNALTELLSRKNELTKLSISKVKLPLKTVGELGTALSADHCSIVELYLQGCAIGDVGFAKINKPLRQMKTIHKLDLSGCSLSNASISMLADTLRMKSLDANETKWIGNLRDDYLVPKKQLGVLILNDNTKIQNSIVELLEAMANEDITCLETLEIRNCSILSNARMNQALTGILQEPPEVLETFDIRQNPILQTMESKTLIQLLMTKLLTSHPNAEYLDLSGVSETDLGATKTISTKKVPRKKVLNVPKGLKTDESDGDFNIDDQYQELPNHTRKEIETIDLLKGIISTFFNLFKFKLSNFVEK